MRRLMLTLLFLTFAAPTLVVDGVLEINQASAANTGCFPGDTAGFPVTIAAPGNGSPTLIIGRVPGSSLEVQDVVAATVVMVPEPSVGLLLRGALGLAGLAAMKGKVFK